ncbi:MAG: T9SS type A sorting domain-containing protein, partial [Bacteroidetes bacterium]|nr:T9SS type A sorting domain-containing protein [Bacteroidota bacterium]
GYILGGESSSGISGDKTTGSNGGREFWIVKIGYIDLAGFKVNSKSQCLRGNVFDFTYTGHGATSFSWNFGESASDTSDFQDPIKVYSNPGKYTIICTVRDSMGNSVTLYDTVVVKPVSSNSIIANICQGNVYKFNNRTLSTTGTYYDTLSNSVGCDSAISLTLTVNNNSSFSYNVQMCKGNVYNFNGNNLSTTGTYIDTLINHVGCDSVVTLDLKVITQITNVINARICNGQSYVFRNKVYFNSGTYYDSLQSTGGCDSVVVLNLKVNSKFFTSFKVEICEGSDYLFGGRSYAKAGTYRDSSMNVGGCDSVTEMVLIVNPSNFVNATAVICYGETYTFGTLNLTKPGSFHITFSNINGCDSMVELKLIVNPLPATPVITYNGTQLSSSAASAYQWYLNNNVLADDSEQTITPIQNGSYTVEVTDSNGCKNISAPFTFNGINSITIDQRITIFPNPTTGEINIIYAPYMKVSVLYITDMNGKLIKKLIPGVNRFTIEELASGMYLLHLDEQVVKVVKN